MIRPEIKRLKQLRLLEEKRELTRDESEEMDRIRYDRELEIMRMVPLPTCCEAAKKYPAVTFQVADVEGRRPTRGYWHAHMSESLSRRFAVGPDGSVWISEMPVAKFCPFCGAALPKMVLKDPLPKTICVVRDGGNYCSTCRERLSSCLCDPQASAFEPKS